MNGHANDAMIRRLERELEERNSAVQGIIGTAQDGERDLNAAEKETLSQLENRMGQLQEQITQLESTASAASNVANRMKQLDQALIKARRTGESEIEYRSAGEYVMDTYHATLGDRPSAERLEAYHRAAAHQKTSDNLGIVPDPIVGEVINFVNSARPLVSAIGVRPRSAIPPTRDHAVKRRPQRSRRRAG